MWHKPGQFSETFLYITYQGAQVPAFPDPFTRADREQPAHWQPAELYAVAFDWTQTNLLIGVPFKKKSTKSHEENQVQGFRKVLFKSKASAFFFFSYLP